MPLPLPRFAGHPAVLLGIGALHLYLASGHIVALTEPAWTVTDIWKAVGAILAAYYFVALASQRRKPQPNPQPIG